jgi:hypothetical protein
VCLEIHACVDTWNFDELIEEASGRWFCQNGDELSVSMGMGSFLVQPSGLTVTQEGLSMKYSNHCLFTHTSRLYQNITCIF